MEWNKIYEELAFLLYRFDIKQRENYKNPGIEFFKLCNNKEEFNTLFKWSKNIKNERMDPFHIFISINFQNSDLYEKFQKIEFFLNVLDSKMDILNNFDIYDTYEANIPDLNITNVIVTRSEEDSEIIWTLFEEVMKKFSSIDSYDELTNIFIKAEELRGITFTVITQFLFWINSSKYISLEKTPYKFLENNDFLNNFENDYESYSSLLKKIRKISTDENIFRLLIKYSYDKDKISDSEKDTISKFISLKIKENVKFQIIGIEIFDDCNKKFSKNLKYNELYKFNDKFEFDGNDIIYFKDRELNLYDMDNLKININVVVGKNGAGKSTLVELLFTIINTMNLVLIDKDEEVSNNLNIHAELIYVDDFIYRIICRGSSIKIERYYQREIDKSQIIYTKDLEHDTNISTIKNLFYNLHINYSLHSLNDIYLGTWVNSLFHKVDDYKTPILLEPHRVNGNIDVNVQFKLTQDRLLSYILNKDDKDSKFSFKQISKKAKAVKIKLRINYKKFTHSKFKSTKEYNEYTKLLKIIELRFNTQYLKLEKEILQSILSGEEIKENKYLHYYIIIYIYNKLIKLRNQDFFSKIEKKDYHKMVEIVLTTNSFKTLKVKRAIFFMKYLDLWIKDCDSSNMIDIDLLTEIINDQLVNNLKKQKLFEIIPPSIFDIGIYFENNNELQSLSSGERQKIFLINTILYHVNNIAIDNKYKNVNIILDEIELYFHPEMQKELISELLFNIKQNYEVDKLRCINIILVTHSPFILSDVTANNILVLDENSNQERNLALPFGANVYDLLKKNFFMTTFMGDYVKSKIIGIIKILDFYYENKNKAREENNNNTKENIIKIMKDFNFIKNKIKTLPTNEILIIIENNIELIERIIENIGEDIIRNELKNRLKELSIDDELDDILNNLREKYKHNPKKLKNVLLEKGKL